MPKIFVALLWHHHQPYYKDLLKDEYIFPWVRLRGTKDYLGMALLLEEFPKAKVTFNIVPSLIVQLQEYAQGRAQETDLALLRKPVETLSFEEKEYLLDNLFFIHQKNQLFPFPRFRELFGKRYLGKKKAGEVVRYFRTQDILDLEVLFTLAWVHPLVLDRDPILQSLKEKGRGFSQSEKEALLECQKKIIGQILPAYKKLQEEGRIEVSTSPFYHPILPILLNPECAKVSLPHSLLPSLSADLKRDAEQQVKKAVSLYKEVFQKSPKGIWPSEGSVCYELIPLLNKEGFLWFASDEDILYKSLYNNFLRDSTGNLQKPADLFRPWVHRDFPRGPCIFFRNRVLSDRIGFHYCHMAAEAAAEDFVNRILQEGSALGEGTGVVAVILDGENPWEAFPENGVTFLRHLYKRLEDHPQLETVTFSEAVEKGPSPGRLEYLYPGSWINHNFGIWIGDEEDQKAWRYLEQTRNLLKTQPDPESHVRAWEEIYIAEGSDWYWWFGKEFFSPQKSRFDALFRNHLKNALVFARMNPPKFLEEPIHREYNEAVFTLPRSFLSVKVDGEAPHFFEWANAGTFIPKSEKASTMGRGAAGLIEALYFGFDTKNLFLRMDLQTPPVHFFKEGFSVQISFLKPKAHRLVAGLLESGSLVLLQREEGPSHAGKEGNPAGEIAAKKIIEMGIPFAFLGFREKEEMEFFLEIVKDEAPIERTPFQNTITLQIPTEAFNEEMWQA